MEFLDSLDIESVNKKCNRVRSWYLYEQYKSLEENQLDATLRLKNKSYQDKILKQELSERRARRRLCDQFKLCQSESRLGKSVRSIPSEVPVSDDDLFDSFCEIHEEYELENYEDNNSQDSKTSKDIDDFTSVAQSRDVYADSIDSVVENVKNDNLANNLRDELEIVKQNIADTINLQLDTVKENIECLEKFTKQADEDEIFIENVSLHNLKSHFEHEQKFNPYSDNSVLAVWSKLVDFAYQIINHNHGNCYNDCSLQLFTAVLACDCLLRGMIRMCNILQPYVSPIKYSTSSSEASLISISKENRKSTICKSKRSYKEPTGNRKKYCKKMRNYNKKFNSEKDWYCNSKDTLYKYLNGMKFRGTSEPFHSRQYSTEKRYSEKSSSRWPEHKIRKSEKFLYGNSCKCHRLKRIVKPILQITRYIESLLEDLEE